MLSRANVFFIPELLEGADDALLIINKMFEDSFEKKNLFISSRKSIINLDETSVLELEKVSRENKMLLLITWVSDDISEGGIVFYDSEKNDRYSFTSNLGSKAIDVVSFLVLCGAGEKISKALFYGI